MTDCEQVRFSELTDSEKSYMIDDARRNLASFGKVLSNDWMIGWVHREICARLMRFFAQVKRRESPRLMLLMPPRHGKSQIVSRFFPAWAFGVDPDISIIAASYGDALARRMNTDVQNLMDSDNYSKIFPDSAFCTNSRVSRTSSLFSIPNGNGSYRSAGVGNSITGMGCDILDIDDPVKDRRDANSSIIRQRVWDWYASTAYTRLMPGGGVLLTQTRWHEDDLAGRLVDAMETDTGDRWEIINFPAIAEKEEYHRHVGEALDAQRYPLSALERIKRTIGEFEWSALYQQHPMPQTGGIFKAEWIRHYDAAPHIFDLVIQSWDLALTDTCDDVAGSVWGMVGGKFYLLDMVARRMDFVTTLKEITEMKRRWPQATTIVIENKANGMAAANVLSDKIPGIVMFNPEGSKVVRANACSAFFESGSVLLPPKGTPWLRNYEAQLLSFPSAAHDDMVDSTTQAVRYLDSKNAKSLIWD